MGTWKQLASRTLFIARLTTAGVASLCLVAFAACEQPAPDDDDDDDDDDDTGPNGPSGPSGGSCSGDAIRCAGSNDIDVCEEGQFTTYGCSDVCNYYGYASDGCAGDTCQCGAPIDPTCLDGVLGFCACIEWAGEPACTDEELQTWYEACHLGQDGGFLGCVSNYVSGDTVDCSAVANSCG